VHTHIALSANLGAYAQNYAKIDSGGENEVDCPSSC
jgi:hypothetical protein